MSEALQVLTITAVTIGFLHTLFGPDHYLPFVVMAKAHNWSRVKTLWITFICGVGHVLGSVILGFIGVALGFAVSKMELIESVRGGLAAWVLIAFGLVYFVWGMRRALKKHRHRHNHLEKPGQTGEAQNLTPWILFIVFVLGPCEPLIPILMYPAAHSNFVGVAIVAGVFSGVTILTMLTIVLVIQSGVDLLPLKRVERFIHALAGFTIVISGMAIQFLGL